MQPDTVLLLSGEQVMTGTLEVVPPNPGMVGVEAGLVVVLDNKFNDVDLDRLVNKTVSVGDGLNSVMCRSREKYGVEILKRLKMVNGRYVA